MSDQYQEVTVVGWGENIGGSCLGVVLGIILFFSSFFVLWWNEGKVDLSQVAKTAVVLSADSATPNAEGQLVSLTGAITANEKLGDNLFLQPGDYIFIDRTVEMFAWNEDEDTNTEKHWGGSKTQTKTYTYHPIWTPEPERSSEFRYPQGHENPAKAIPDQFFKVKAARIGRYALDTTKFDYATNHQDNCTEQVNSHHWKTGGAVNLNTGRLSLNTQNTKPSPNVTLVGDYLFKGTGSPQAPVVGDLRICYATLPVNTTVTVFGKLESGQIVPNLHNDTYFYRLILGTHDQAIAALQQEHQIWTWVFRAIGFLMMWIGLAISAAPISALLDVIPLLGTLAEAVTGVASFVAALVFSVITILVSQLAHSPSVLMVSIGIAFGVLVLLRIGRRIIAR